MVTDYQDWIRWSMFSFHEEIITPSDSETALTKFFLRDGPPGIILMLLNKTALGCTEIWIDKGWILFELQERVHMFWSTNQITWLNFTGVRKDLFIWRLGRKKGDVEF